MDHDWADGNGAGADVAEWRVVIGDDSLTVQHLCGAAGTLDDLFFDADWCLFSCRACGGSLAVRRDGAWGE